MELPGVKPPDEGDIFEHLILTLVETCDNLTPEFISKMRNQASI